MSTVICDLDGTLCDHSHRVKYALVKDWDSYHAALMHDRPRQKLLELLGILKQRYDLVFSTGRPEKCRGATEDWLIRVGLPPAEYRLFMRPDGDMRHDYQVKKDHLKILGGPSKIFMVFEDRNRVADMWREKGITCLQPERGDF